MSAQTIVTGVGGRICRRGVAVMAVVVVLCMANAAGADDLVGQPIYARNNTSSPIWVAAYYKPPGSGGYVANGFWKVNPGRTMLIVYNGNARYIYFYARTEDGKYWTGNDVTVNVRGESLKMFEMDTGMGYNPWTMNFN